MSDLFSPLHVPEQLPTPPAADVRRRGDALRRRRQALQAGGVAALVCVVALGAAGLTGGLDRSSEAPPAGPPTSVAPSPSEPSPTGSSDRITTIPASLDLVRDWRDGDGAGEEEVLVSGPRVQWLSDVIECDASHSPADESTDHLGVRYSVPGLTQARDLRAFADDATARQVAEDYVSWFRDCPSFSIDGGASETRNRVTPLDLGEQGWLVSQTYFTDDVPQIGESLLVVSRVGNSILVGWRYSEGPGSTDPKASQRNADALVDELRPVVSEVECTFGNAGGC
jgi:hypothetical protein